MNNVLKLTCSYIIHVFNLSKSPQKNKKIEKCIERYKILISLLYRYRYIG